MSYMTKLLIAGSITLGGCSNPMDISNPRLSNPYTIRRGEQPQIITVRENKYNTSLDSTFTDQYNNAVAAIHIDGKAIVAKPGDLIKPKGKSVEALEVLAVDGSATKDSTDDAVDLRAWE